MSGKASRGRPARRVKPLRSAKMGVSTRTRRAKQGAGNSAGGGVPFDPAISVSYTPCIIARPCTQLVMPATAPNAEHLYSPSLLQRSGKRQRHVQTQELPRHGSAADIGKKSSILGRANRDDRGRPAAPRAQRERQRQRQRPPTATPRSAHCASQGAVTPWPHAGAGQVERKDSGVAGAHAGRDAWAVASAEHGPADSPSPSAQQREQPGQHRKPLK